MKKFLKFPYSKLVFSALVLAVAGGITFAEFHKTPTVNFKASDDSTSQTPQSSVSPVGQVDPNSSQVGSSTTTTSNSGSDTTTQPPVTSTPTTSDTSSDSSEPAQNQTISAPAVPTVVSESIIDGTTYLQNTPDKMWDTPQSCLITYSDGSTKTVAMFDYLTGITNQSGVNSQTTTPMGPNNNGTSCGI